MSKITKILAKIKSLFSKHKAASLIVTVSVLLVLATVAILLGGASIGWDIAGFFTSPTFILIIAISILIVFACIYYILVGRHSRW
jgi:hypothetical protein